MKLGVVIEETWSFFKEIYQDFQEHHQTELFERRKIKSPLFQDRLSWNAFRQDARAFLNRNDVIFFEWASEALANFSRLPKENGVVTRLHRYEMYHWVDKIDWSFVDRIIVVSDAKRTEFSAQFPAHAHKLVVIPEAISLEQFPYSQRSYKGNLGILCHLTPRKRVYELILAFSILAKDHPHFHLHIGGGEHSRFKDYYISLRDLVTRLGLDERVTFHGSISNPLAWYQEIDIFISNSYSEGLQVSPMEAMASGCYCLSHNWPGARQLLPAAKLYETDQELVDLILAYDSLSPAAQAAESAYLRAMVEQNFDVNKIKGKIRQVVEEVYEHKPRM